MLATGHPLPECPKQAICGLQSCFLSFSESLTLYSRDLYEITGSGVTGILGKFKKIGGFFPGYSKDINRKMWK